MSEANYGKPTRGRILVKQEEEIKTTMGGLHIPDSAREKLNEGIVLVIGEERINDNGTILPHQVAVGDRVVFGKYVALGVTIDDNEFLIMKESDVLVILPPKTEEQIQREKDAKSLILSL